jgi:hypothetical protein
MAVLVNNGPESPHVRGLYWGGSPRVDAMSALTQQSSPTVHGSWRTPIPAPPTSHSRTATVGPAGGTPCARCGCSVGTSADGNPRAQFPPDAFTVRMSCPADTAPGSVWMYMN